MEMTGGYQRQAAMRQVSPGNPDAIIPSRSNRKQIYQHYINYNPNLVSGKGGKWQVGVFERCREIIMYK